MNLYLGKAKILYKNSFVGLHELPIIILLGNFFQFPPLIERFLWDVSLTLHKEYK